MMWIAWAFMAVFGSYLAWQDFVQHKLPNKAVYPWFVIAIVIVSSEALITSHFHDYANALAGAFIHGLFYLVLRFFSARAIGMGDVKLAAVLGVYLGWYGLITVPLAVIIAFVLGALYSIAGITLQKLTLKSSIPFGPMMLVATPIAVLLFLQS